MGSAAPLGRELILTDLSLSIAAARQRGDFLDPVATARRLLQAHPDSGVSEEELVHAALEALGSSEPDVVSGVLGEEFRRSGAGEPGDLPSEGTHSPEA